MQCRQLCNRKRRHGGARQGTRQGTEEIGESQTRGSSSTDNVGHIGGSCSTDNVGHIGGSCSTDNVGHIGGSCSTDNVGHIGGSCSTDNVGHIGGSCSTDNVGHIGGSCSTDNVGHIGGSCSTDNVGHIGGSSSTDNVGHIGGGGGGGRYVCMQSSDALRGIIWFMVKSYSKLQTVVSATKFPNRNKLRWNDVWQSSMSCCEQWWILCYLKQNSNIFDFLKGHSQRLFKKTSQLLVMFHVPLLS